MAVGFFPPSGLKFDYIEDVNKKAALCLSSSVLMSKAKCKWSDQFDVLFHRLEYYFLYLFFDSIFSSPIFYQIFNFFLI